MKSTSTVTVAYGDGIGPEIMSATMDILKAAKAQLNFEVVEIGEKVYESGNTSGIPANVWDSLRKTKVFLKAPMTTPQGGGYKSLNVTLRKTLGLFANVRPCVAYSPFVKTQFSKMNVVIVRENEEDLYGGIEHRQTHDVTQCLKLISRPGTEKIVRYAFEYAKHHNRKKVTCLTKDNIMKITDGLFHQVFNEIAAEYPDIESDHMIIDIGSAKLAADPERFDVVVTSNLYGDIISDIAAEVSGSVGIGPSVNLGEDVAMFEAIHGSAPDIAGRDIANPSGLLLSAVMMLVHLKQPEPAELIHNAWLCALEDGIHTGDIYTQAGSIKKVGTKEFTSAVIERLGKQPKKLAVVRYSQDVQRRPVAQKPNKHSEEKQLVGVDIFIDWKPGQPADLAAKLSAAGIDGFKLSLITNRGVKVWPDGFPETFCVDHWRCRFLEGPSKSPTPIKHSKIISVLEKIQNLNLDFIKTENLYLFDGKPGYSLGQGE